VSEVPIHSGASLAMSAHVSLDDAEAAELWLLDIFSERFELLDRVALDDILTGIQIRTFA
jgi:hypothetical protein